MIAEVVANFILCGCFGHVWMSVTSDSVVMTCMYCGAVHHTPAEEIRVWVRSVR
jgi:hypothetical protein